MTMGSDSNVFDDTMNSFDYIDDALLPNFDQFENFANMFQLKDNQFDLSFMGPPAPPLDHVPSFVSSTTNRSSEVDSPDDSDDNVLKFINSILMEENIEQKPSMFHDPLALQATERSLYDVIGEKYPSFPNQPPFYLNSITDSLDDHLLSSSTEQSSLSNSSGNTDSVDSNSFKQADQSYPFDHPPATTPRAPTESLFRGSTKSFDDFERSLRDSSTSKDIVSSIFTDSESILQFQRGMEEASKFLPKNNQLLINLDNYVFSPRTNDEPSNVEVQVDGESREISPNGSKGKRGHHEWDNLKDDERSSKQSAVFEEEAEISELFDKVLLCPDVKAERAECIELALKTEPVDNSQVNGHQPNGTNKKNRVKKQGKNNEVVDLSSLLISCAQSVAADDRRTANEQLKNIRQYCSPLGNGSQRVANIFANGLEARLAGTGSQKYTALACKRISTTEKLKAYQIYLSRCPYKKLSMIFSNKLIFDLANGSSKKKLHIIDFGISYGFQWPILIQFLSTLDKPPELKITGIEFPLPGFRPADMVEETGRRLGKYCERFNIKFQYQPIAQNWETINLEDLNLAGDEAIAVNCLFRFKNLLDESVTEDSPRDAVLRLIKKINPDIFISHTTNASFNSPFFVTRFREALFFYSSFFDMLDTVVPRESQQRTNFEQAFFGREVMNIIACEGMERVERPETYKQWQLRYKRAGFKIQPLKVDLLKKLKAKMVGYHEDFVIDGDGKWFLQGWKGRIFCASSCWVPAEK